jgi:deoxyribonuclease-4
MLGSHLSIAGGMVNALLEARRLKLDCVQVFTRNQRTWRTTPLDPADRSAWLEALAELGWDDPDAPGRVVSHNSYLINLASPDTSMWSRSVKLHRVELERCETLSIPFCVAHPGAHLGEALPAGQPQQLGRAFTRDERSGLRRIVKALNRLHRELPGYRTITCLETTVGSGSNLGFDFAHLAFIREQVREPDRVGFCLDTCHVTAAGYDLSTPAGARAVLERWDEACGFDPLHVIHLNDSVGALGSRRDRHAHIGDGACGGACFQAIMNHRKFADVPKILETPKGTTEKGTPWDLVNVRRLKRLAKARKSSR